MDKKEFQERPRCYAIGLVEDGIVSADFLLNCALDWMSSDEVRGMLEANMLEPEEAEEAEEEI